MILVKPHLSYFQIFHAILNILFDKGIVENLTSYKITYLLILHNLLKAYLEHYISAYATEMSQAGARECSICIKICSYEPTRYS